MQGVFAYIGTFGGRKMAWACSGGYTFGFNGQMRDDEVYGEGNSYTAEFWQYDPRLGRRWNVDPVVKPWRSSYDAFDNKPIIKIDPKGDDDYFDANGKYLGTDGSKTSTKIRIIRKPINEIGNLYNTNGTISVKNGQANSEAFSSFLMNKKIDYKDRTRTAIYIYHNIMLMIWELMGK